MTTTEGYVIMESVEIENVESEADFLNPSSHELLSNDRADRIDELLSVVSPNIAEKDLFLLKTKLVIISFVDETFKVQNNARKPLKHRTFRRKMKSNFLENHVHDFKVERKLYDDNSNVNNPAVKISNDKWQLTTKNESIEDYLSFTVSNLKDNNYTDEIYHYLCDQDPWCNATIYCERKMLKCREELRKNYYSEDAVYGQIGYITEDLHYLNWVNPPLNYDCAELYCRCPIFMRLKLEQCSHYTNSYYQNRLIRENLSLEEVAVHVQNHTKSQTLSGSFGGSVGFFHSLKLNNSYKKSFHVMSDQHWGSRSTKDRFKRWFSKALPDGLLSTHSHTLHMDYTYPTVQRRDSSASMLSVASTSRQEYKYEIFGDDVKTEIEFEIADEKPVIIEFKLEEDLLEKKNKQTKTKKKSTDLSTSRTHSKHRISESEEENLAMRCLKYMTESQEDNKTKSKRVLEMINQVKNTRKTSTKRQDAELLKITHMVEEYSKRISNDDVSRHNSNEAYDIPMGKSVNTSEFKPHTMRNGSYNTSLWIDNTPVASKGIQLKARQLFTPDSYQNNKPNNEVGYRFDDLTTGKTVNETSISSKQLWLKNEQKYWLPAGQNIDENETDHLLTHEQLTTVNELSGKNSNTVITYSETNVSHDILLVEEISTDNENLDGDFVKLELRYGDQRPDQEITTIQGDTDIMTSDIDLSLLESMPNTPLEIDERISSNSVNQQDNVPDKMYNIDEELREFSMERTSVNGSDEDSSIILKEDHIHHLESPAVIKKSLVFEASESEVSHTDIDENFSVQCVLKDEFSPIPRDKGAANLSKLENFNEDNVAVTPHAENDVSTLIDDNDISEKYYQHDTLMTDSSCAVYQDEIRYSIKEDFVTEVLNEEILESTPYIQHTVNSIKNIGHETTHLKTLSCTDIVSPIYMDITDALPMNHMTIHSDNPDNVIQHEHIDLSDDCPFNNDFDVEDSFDRLERNEDSEAEKNKKMNEFVKHIRISKENVIPVKHEEDVSSTDYRQCKSIISNKNSINIDNDEYHIASDVTVCDIIPVIISSDITASNTLVTNRTASLVEEEKPEEVTISQEQEQTSLHDPFDNLDNGEEPDFELNRKMNVFLSSISRDTATASKSSFDIAVLDEEEIQYSHVERASPIKNVDYRLDEGYCSCLELVEVVDSGHCVTEEKIPNFLQRSTITHTMSNGNKEADSFDQCVISQHRTDEFDPEDIAAALCRIDQQKEEDEFKTFSNQFKVENIAILHSYQDSAKEGEPIRTKLTQRLNHVKSIDDCVETGCIEVHDYSITIKDKPTVKPKPSRKNHKNVKSTVDENEMTVGIIKDKNLLGMPMVSWHHAFERLEKNEDSECEKNRKMNAFVTHFNRLSSEAKLESFDACEEDSIIPRPYELNKNYVNHASTPQSFPTLLIGVEPISHGPPLVKRRPQKLSNKINRIMITEQLSIDEYGSNNKPKYDNTDAVFQSIDNGEGLDYEINHNMNNFMLSMSQRTTEDREQLFDIYNEDDMPLPPPKIKKMDSISTKSLPSIETMSIEVGYVKETPPFVKPRCRKSQKIGSKPYMVTENVSIDQIRNKDVSIEQELDCVFDQVDSGESLDYEVNQKMNLFVCDVNQLSTKEKKESLQICDEDVLTKSENAMKNIATATFQSSNNVDIITDNIIVGSVEEVPLFENCINNEHNNVVTSKELILESQSVEDINKDIPNYDVDNIFKSVDNGDRLPHEINQRMNTFVYQITRLPSLMDTKSIELSDECILDQPRKQITKKLSIHKEQLPDFEVITNVIDVGMVEELPPCNEQNFKAFSPVKHKELITEHPSVDENTNKEAPNDDDIDDIFDSVDSGDGLAHEVNLKMNSFVHQITLLSSGDNRKSFDVCEEDVLDAQQAIGKPRKLIFLDSLPDVEAITPANMEVGLVAEMPSHDEPRMDKPLSVQNVRELITEHPLNRENTHREANKEDDFDNIFDNIDIGNALPHEINQKMNTFVTQITRLPLLEDKNYFELSEECVLDQPRKDIGKRLSIHKKELPEYEIITDSIDVGLVKELPHFDEQNFKQLPTIIKHKELITEHPSVDENTNREVPQDDDIDNIFDNVDSGDGLAHEVNLKMNSFVHQINQLSVGENIKSFDAHEGDVLKFQQENKKERQTFSQDSSSDVETITPAIIEVGFVVEIPLDAEPQMEVPRSVQTFRELIMEHSLEYENTHREVNKEDDDFDNIFDNVDNGNALPHEINQKMNTFVNQISLLSARKDNNECDISEEDVIVLPVVQSKQCAIEQETPPRDQIVTDAIEVGFVEELQPCVRSHPESTLTRSLNQELVTEYTSLVETLKREDHNDNDFGNIFDNIDNGQDLQHEANQKMNTFIGQISIISQEKVSKSFDLCEENVPEIPPNEIKTETSIYQKKQAPEDETITHAIEVGIVEELPSQDETLLEPFSPRSSNQDLITEDPSVHENITGIDFNDHRLDKLFESVDRGEVLDHEVNHMMSLFVKNITKVSSAERRTYHIDEDCNTMTSQPPMKSTLPDHTDESPISIDTKDIEVISLEYCPPIVKPRWKKSYQHRTMISESVYVDERSSSDIPNQNNVEAIFENIDRGDDLDYEINQKMNTFVLHVNKPPSKVEHQMLECSTEEILVSRKAEENKLVCNFGEPSLIQETIIGTIEVDCVEELPSYEDVSPFKKAHHKTLGNQTFIMEEPIKDEDMNSNVSNIEELDIKLKLLQNGDALNHNSCETMPDFKTSFSCPILAKTMNVWSVALDYVDSNEHFVESILQLEHAKNVLTEKHIQLGQCLPREIMLIVKKNYTSYIRAISILMTNLTTLPSIMDPGLEHGERRKALLRSGRWFSLTTERDSSKDSVATPDKEMSLDELLKDVPSSEHHSSSDLKEQLRRADSFSSLTRTKSGRRSRGSPSPVRKKLRSMASSSGSERDIAIDKESIERISTYYRSSSDDISVIQQASLQNVASLPSSPETTRKLISGCTTPTSCYDSEYLTNDEAVFETRQSIKDSQEAPCTFDDAADSMQECSKSMEIDMESNQQHTHVSKSKEQVLSEYLENEDNIDAILSYFESALPRALSASDVPSASWYTPGYELPIEIAREAKRTALNRLSQSVDDIAPQWRAVNKLEMPDYKDSPLKRQYSIESILSEVPIDKIKDIKRRMRSMESLDDVSVTSSDDRDVGRVNIPSIFLREERGLVPVIVSKPPKDLERERRKKLAKLSQYSRSENCLLSNRRSELFQSD